MGKKSTKVGRRAGKAPIGPTAGPWCVDELPPPGGGFVVRQKVNGVVVGAFGRNKMGNYRISQNEARENAYTFWYGLCINQERPILFRPTTLASIHEAVKKEQANVRAAKKRVRR